MILPVLIMLFSITAGATDFPGFSGNRFNDADQGYSSSGHYYAYHDNRNRSLRNNYNGRRAYLNNRNLNRVKDIADQCSSNCSYNRSSRPQMNRPGPEEYEAYRRGYEDGYKYAMKLTGNTAYVADHTGMDSPREFVNSD